MRVQTPIENINKGLSNPVFYMYFQKKKEKKGRLLIYHEIVEMCKRY